MKRLIAVMLFTILGLMSGNLSAEPPATPRLSAAFPAAHVGAGAGLSHFFEYDFGGTGPHYGLSGGFDPFTFLSVDARLTPLFASTAVLGRIAHGRPGRWGGAYAGPRAMHPVTTLLPGFGLGGTVGYEYRYEFIRAAIDFTAGYGWSRLDYTMWDAFLHVGYSFNSGRSER